MIPLITTIIPAYNAEATLAQAVGSLVTQNIERHEIIIVDDGSTDGTRSLTDRIARTAPSVRLIMQPNGGVSAARNAGLAAARGDWIHFLDSDDWMLADGLRRLLDAASNSPAACGSSVWFTGAGDPLSWSTGPSLPPGVVDFGLDKLLEQNQFQPGAMIVRRCALMDLAFDRRFSAGEDWDLWLRLAERGVRWAIVDRNVCAYRLRANGLSRSYSRMAEQSQTILTNAYRRARRGHLQTSNAPSVELARSLRLIALHQATAAALNDETGGELPASILRQCHTPLAIEPRELADAAFWMIPFADGRAPNAWATADDATLSRYAAALDGWWKRCIAERWLNSPDALRARSELAALAVPPGAIAERLVCLCAPQRETVLHGLGSNARHVVAALRASGQSFTARDRRYLNATRLTLDGHQVRVVEHETPLDPAAQHIVTPSLDAEIVSRLPRDLPVHRWESVRKELHASTLARLDAAWPCNAAERAAA